MAATTTTLASALLVAIAVTAGCAKHDSSPVGRAVENTKDALDVRDHEKLKDAGEDIADAARDAKQGAKDAIDGKK